jgi:K+-transporting ATPase ATPase A chain
MSIWSWLQLALYVAILLVLVRPLGLFMARVYGGERTFLHPLFGWLERLTYKAAGVDPSAEMNWKTYRWRR